MLIKDIYLNDLSSLLSHFTRKYKVTILARSKSIHAFLPISVFSPLSEWLDMDLSGNN